MRSQPPRPAQNRPRGPISAASEPSSGHSGTLRGDAAPSLQQQLGRATQLGDGDDDEPSIMDCN